MPGNNERQRLVGGKIFWLAARVVQVVPNETVRTERLLRCRVVCMPSRDVPTSDVLWWGFRLSYDRGRRTFFAECLLCLFFTDRRPYSSSAIEYHSIIIHYTKVVHQQYSIAIVSDRNREFWRGSDHGTTTLRRLTYFGKQTQTRGELKRILLYFFRLAINTPHSSGLVVGFG